MQVIKKIMQNTEKRIIIKLNKDDL